MRGRWLARLLGLAAFVPLITAAQDHEHATPGAGVGTVNFATTCRPSAHAAFERGVALLHNFAFPGAHDAFTDAIAADPQCAIAFWGLALTAWGNPFAAGIKTDAQLQQGRDFIARAEAVTSISAREHEWVLAASRLFVDTDRLDQPARTAAYCDALRALSAHYPDDDEAAIFYALALAFSASPTDKTYANQVQAGAILERLWPTHPDHPGITHYLIHAYDVPALAPRALAAARRYAAVAPDVPHALHMPSHTFTRLGDWDDSIATNLLSQRSARREGSTAEELHANDYLMYAYLQTGQDAAARALLATVPDIAARFDPAKPSTGAPPSAGFFALAAMPARFALERGDWTAAARLDRRTSPFPFADALTDFAHALGAARSGDTAAASAALAALANDRDRLVAGRETYWAEQVNISRRSADAWLRLARGDTDAALATMRDAADREDATEKNAITPGPIAPARELLGEMLLALGRSAEALPEFERTLVHEPNRFRAVAGAMTAAEAAGVRATARDYALRLLAICAKADAPGRPAIALAHRLSAGDEVPPSPAETSAPTPRLGLQRSFRAR